MNTLPDTLYVLLPIVGAILLAIGIKTNRVNYLIAALWLCLISLMFQYQTAGGEVLGTYFDYQHASVYSFNLIVLIITLLCLFYKIPFMQGKRSRYIMGLLSACTVVGGLLLLTNLWVNAWFIETKHAGTPIMQVATFKPLDYCSYRYVFYKVGQDGKISYMCPNHYGIIPSIGYLDVSPDFVLNHLVQQVQAKHKLDDKAH